MYLILTIILTPSTAQSQDSNSDTGDTGIAASGGEAHVIRDSSYCDVDALQESLLQQYQSESEAQKRSEQRLVSGPSS